MAVAILADCKTEMRLTLFFMVGRYIPNYSLSGTLGCTLERR
jgi:hypothetical protein